MLQKTIWIFIFALFCKTAIGQSGTDTAKTDIISNEFSVNNTFKFRDVYVGTYDNTRANFLLNTELKYWLRFGLFFSVCSDVVLGGKKGSNLSDLGFTIGYDQYFLKDDALNIYAAYSYYWQNTGSKIKVLQRIRNLQNHDINLYASFDNKFIVPSVNIEVLTGSVTDLIITPEINHPFYITESEKKGTFAITPYTNLNIGTANNLLTYDNALYQGADGLSFLNVELGLRLNYEYRFLELEPFFSFSHALRDFNSTVINNKNIIWGGLSLNFTF